MAKNMLDLIVYGPCQQRICFGNCEVLAAARSVTVPARVLWTARQLKIYLVGGDAPPPSRVRAWRDGV